MAGSRVVGVACLLTLAAHLRAEGPGIDHAAVTCMVAENFPRIEARIIEPEAVARARVQFRGEGGPWYFVDMKRSGGMFTGVLPRPKTSLEKISYYIEATDRRFRVSQTQEFAAEVVPQAALCADVETMAGIASTASIIVGAPAGAAAAVPAGFSSAGVVSATGTSAVAAGSSAGSGGGIGTAATVGIIAGGVAAAGVAVAVSSDGDGSPTTTLAAGAPGPTPTTTLAPAPPPTTLAPCPACYAGNWQLTATLVARADPPVCRPEPQIVVTFNVNADGTFRIEQDCSPPGTINAMGLVTFTSAGDTCPGAPPGGTCPAGSGTGTCSSPRLCAGTFSQGGNQLTWVMNRLSP